jgi:hypothetical protein
MRASIHSKASLAFLVATAWSTSAAASRTFPPVVDQHLKLTGAATIEHAVAPPDGCLLCHTTELGGTGSNNAFGALLRQYGAVGGNPATVGPALDAVEMVDPHAIDDVIMGINPNDDHMTPTESLPQPSYGCSVASESVPGQGVTGVFMAVASFASLALFAGRTRRAARRPL